MLFLTFTNDRSYKYIIIKLNLKVQNLHVIYYTVYIIYKTVLLEDFSCTIVYVKHKEISFENV